jgi:hypothetical protein
VNRTTAILALCLLTGCALLFPEAYPTPETGPDGLGTDRPHAVVVGVSGHPLSVSSNPHRENLVNRGTLGAMVNVLAQGNTRLVYAWDHADAFYSLDSFGNLLTPYDQSEFVSFGFLHLVEDLRFIRDEWVDGVETPTRVILVGHSHGVVWAHIAAQMVPDLPIEVMVDLDGTSEAWDGFGPTGLTADGWDQVIVDYTNATGAAWPFEIWRARDAWEVEGQAELADIEDIVPANVATNLEIRTEGLLLYDADPNVRMDGSFDGIEVFLSYDGHDEVADPHTEAIGWVLNFLVDGEAR